MTTILVIDDDTNLGTLFCETLALNGFATLRAATGQAGIQLTRRHHPQLVVCDIGLPDISVHSVLKGARSHPATTTIPVIMVTGRTDADTFRHSMEHGADDYLTKPVDLDGFLRAVQTQLTKRKQLAEHFASVSAEPAEPAPISLEDLETRLEASAPSPQLWMIQLRNYGAIQARYGHVFGQLVLQSVGQQLQQWRCHESALPIETYRLDERFVILLSAPPGLVDQAIASLQTRLKQPRVVSNHRLSLDICVRPVSCLDLAANKPREGMASLPSPSLVERLRRAIQRDELQLYFQPQVDLNSGQIIGAEALVRWIVPGEPAILPVQFIPVAEDSGLMPSLGDWILGAALQQLSRWQTMRLSGISLAINLSAYQLQNPIFIDRLMSLVSIAGVTPVMIDLELPEGLIMADLDRAKPLLATLQQGGFSTAIDDFGSGYSSLSHLQHLPVNILKLDKCFVRDLHHNKSNQIIVKAIMDMAQGLNIATVASGVETARELSILKQLGCQSMQGYLFSPALTAQDFETLLLDSSHQNSLDFKVNV